MANDLWYVIAPFYDLAMHRVWVDAQVSWTHNAGMIQAQGRLIAYPPEIKFDGPALEPMPARFDATLDQPFTHRPDLFREMRLEMRSPDHRGEMTAIVFGPDRILNLDDPWQSGPSSISQVWWEEQETVTITFTRYLDAMATLPVGSAIQEPPPRI
jgi:hypothetical protein